MKIITKTNVFPIAFIVPIIHLKTSKIAPNSSIDELIKSLLVTKKLDWTFELPIGNQKA